MNRRSRIWLVATALFLAINAGGAIYALVEGELMHAELHLALLVPGVFLFRHLAARRHALAQVGPRDLDLVTSPDSLSDRLRGLEQSVDAVALEIERIGEGQRFITNMYSEDAARAPVDRDHRDPTPNEPKAHEPDARA